MDLTGRIYAGSPAHPAADQEPRISSRQLLAAGNWIDLDRAAVDRDPARSNALFSRGPELRLVETMTIQIGRK